MASGAQILNIEPIFFFYKTVDSDFYLKIIQDFIALLKEAEWYVWFQQDGAAAHTHDRKNDGHFSQIFRR